VRLTESERALARRAIAAHPWPWPRGARSLFVNDDGLAVGEFASLGDQGHGQQVAGWRRGEELPDLTDPATLGVLRELVRVRWSDRTAHTEPHPLAGGWRCAYGPHLSRVFSTEAEALVFALEDTRGRPGRQSGQEELRR